VPSLHILTDDFPENCFARTSLAGYYESIISILSIKLNGIGDFEKRGLRASLDFLWGIQN
jgi:hypothetical protein